LQETARALSQQGYQTLALPTDMRDQQQVQRMIDQAYASFGQIDILVNNAGQAVAGTVETLNPQEWQQIIDLNLFGPVYAMQAVIPKMRQQGGGLILNVSSMVSKMKIPGLSGYASTKAALNLLTDTAREELAPDNIRVITVLPRLTSTDFGKNALGQRESRPYGRREGQNENYRPVIDTPEHVANKILEAVEKEPAEQYME
jgi:short-subunit dehydrogenase